MIAKTLKTKYIVLLGIAVVVVIAIVIGVKAGSIKHSPAVTEPVVENPSARAREEGISPRQAQIENYKEFPQQFPSVQIDGKTMYLLAFPQSLPIHKEQNFPEERYQGRAGLIIFSDGENVWESTEELTEISQERTKFQDLTGDGIPEIITIDRGGGNVSYSLVYVYKWNGTGFDLVTPYPEGIIEISGDNSSLALEQGGIKDIDGDGIYEIVGFTERRADENSDTWLKFKSIYKFNGSAYTLWKEISISTQ